MMVRMVVSDQIDREEEHNRMERCERERGPCLFTVC